MDIGDEECLVCPDPMSMVVVDIYKLSLISESTPLVYLAEALLVNAQYLASFKKKVTIKEVLSKVFDENVLKAALRQSMFDISRSRK